MDIFVIAITHIVFIDYNCLLVFVTYVMTY